MDSPARVAPSRLADLNSDMTKPHDGYSFEQLRDSYNFQTTTCWQRTFLRLLAAEADRLRSESGTVRVLDIGCGNGIGRRPHWTAAVREHFDELWGIEPDPSIKPQEGVIDHFQTATLETADLPEGYFDLSYSFMVVEHVADPHAFLSAVQRSLRPGGVHFFVTVNGHHYFAKMAKFMKAMKIEDAMLRVLRGKQTTDSYHYPVQYRMNRPSQIDRLAREHGFGNPEYAFIEEDGPKPYLRGPLKPFWSLMMAKRRRIENPRQLLTMYCRMRKQV